MKKRTAILIYLATIPGTLLLVWYAGNSEARLEELLWPTAKIIVALVILGGIAIYTIEQAMDWKKKSNQSRLLAVTTISALMCVLGVGGYSALALNSDWGSYLILPAAMAVMAISNWVKDNVL